METRKALVFKKANEMRIEEKPMPELKPSEVLVRVKAVGICGSDIHFFKNGSLGQWTLSDGSIIGHEASGQIESIGEKVTTKKVGDRVSIEPGFPCMMCDYCKSGIYNMCKEVLFLSCPPAEGALTEYITVPENFTYIIPDSMSFDEAAMMEPLAVALQVLKNARFSPGETIAILGSGPIGLTILLAAKAIGSPEVYMTDITPYRINFALEFGATAAYNTREVDFVDEIMKATNGRGMDVVIETTSSQEAYLGCTAIANKCGSVVFLGVASGSIAQFNILDIVDKELMLKGNFRYANEFENAIRLASSGLIDIKKIITHKFPLEKVVEAFNLVYEQRDKVLKAIINL